VSQIDSLLKSYGKHIAIPWRETAPAQRVIFCVYDSDQERNLRLKYGEFELETRQNQHEWALFDLTPSFENWLSTRRYAENYFKNPQLLPTLLPRYLSFIIEQFKAFLQEKKAGENHVIAIGGVGSLFGFLKIKELVDKLAPEVEGRLLVFFPGSHEGNNYRLLDAYDGWNYLAVSIKSDSEF
jgi:hypothetical protein